ncbi:rCG49759, partial [Rattus norvegicus]
MRTGTQLVNGGLSVIGKQALLSLSLSLSLSHLSLSLSLSLSLNI